MPRKRRIAVCATLAAILFVICNFSYDLNVDSDSDNTLVDSDKLLRVSNYSENKTKKYSPICVSRDNEYI